MALSRSWYGLMASIAACALRSFAEDTSFIAEVIFSVLCTDAMRPFISFNVGMRFLDYARNDKISSC